jgi:hypothetical protein
MSFRSGTIEEERANADSLARFLKENGPKPPEHDIAIESQLAGKTYDYDRIGYDRRPMTLGPNGRIDRGGGACEHRWMVARGNPPELLILGGGCVTAVLTNVRPGVWEGRWLIFECMPLRMTEMS